jgi:hypothetical protein
MNDKHNNPDFCHPSYDRMLPDWKQAQDFYAGTRAVRAGDYLVKFSREEKADYDARRKSSELYNVFAGTINAAVGMVFKSAVVPKGDDGNPIPKPLADLFPDIDACGRDLSNFLRETFTNAVRDGHSFILVDAPPTQVSETRPTLADVADRRPFWINYTADQLINWDFERRGGKNVLTRIMLKECVIESKGTYGKESVEQIREITETDWKIHRKTKDERGREEWTVYDEGVRSVSEITLVCVMGSRRTAEFESIPPYADLLEMNIVHYNKQSILDTALKYIVPMPVFQVPTFEDVDKFASVVASPNRSVILWGEHASASYLELKGESVAELRTDIENREARMAKMGIEKFAPVEDAVQKTAFEVGSDNRRSMSEIGLMAKNLEDGVELAFYYTGLYLNAIGAKNTVDADNLKLRLQLDYDKLTFSLDQIRLFKELADAGYLSKQTLLEMLPVIAEMPEEFDVMEEMRRILDESAERAVLQSVAQPRITVSDEQNPTVIGK